MSKKNVRNFVDPKQTIPGMALVAADSFYELAQLFFTKYSTDIKTMGEAFGREPGSLISASTNLALSVELYLKGVLLQYGHSLPKTHNLLELFNLLPDEVKQKVRTKYLSLKPKEGGIRAISLAIQFNVQSSGVTKKNYSLVDRSIEAILERASDAFVTWRYMFEMVGASNKSLEIEFGHLSAVALAFKGLFIVALDKTSSPNI